MKRLILLLYILLLSDAIYAQQLSWRFANPRIIRLSAVDHLQFDVQVKCDVPGTFLWAATIKFNFNNTTFNNTASNWSILPQGIFSGANSNQVLTSKYSVIKTITGTAPDKVYNIALTGDINVAGNGPNTTDFAEIPTEWTTIIQVSARLAVFTGDALAGIDFLESGMNGFQQYILKLGPQSIAFRDYTNPNLYDDRNFINCYTGRFYSTSQGWTQIGGATDWGTIVSTTAWEDATITQTDNVEALANNIYIGNGSAITPTLTIPSSKWLIVAGTLTNTGTSANLVVASGGSLINNTSNVPAKVERYIAGYTDASHGWHFLSSPVAEQAISAFHTPNSGSDFYSWDEPTNLWINRTASGGGLNGSFETNFDVGIGYLMANNSSGITTFTGTLNNADVTINGLSNNGSSYYKGWHLLGNPFSSALEWNNGNWILSNVDANSQIWNEANASYTVLAADGIIPAMNGFMVHTSGSGSLTIPLSSRLHNSQAWYKKEQLNNDRILLVARDPEGQTAQESIIRFDAGATEGYDNDYDSYFIGGFASMFYSVAGNESYALNTLPEITDNLEIPFSFIKNGSSSFSIELAKSLPDAVVYLVDKKAVTIQNLSENPVYNFTASDGDQADRFTLRFRTLFSGVNPANESPNFSAWYNKGDIHFSALPEKVLSMSLIDMAGREIVSLGKPETDKVTIGKKLAIGYYMLRIRMTDKIVFKKLFIN